MTNKIPAMIVTSYTRLFRIVFLHDFYRDPEDILKDISIQPDPATRQLMNGYRLICKIIKNRLDCYVATRVTIRTAGGKTVADILNKPLVDFDESRSMVFNLIINSGRFTDTSNIRSFYPGNSILAFGNDSGNKQNSVLSLTKRLPAYKSSDTYLPGMLVTNASGQAFLALKEVVHPVLKTPPTFNTGDSSIRLRMFRNRISQPSQENRFHLQR
jgi:hypothetical protein